MSRAAITVRKFAALAISAVLTCVFGAVTGPVLIIAQFFDPVYASAAHYRMFLLVRRVYALVAGPVGPQ
jgi:hypothetical protein